MEKKYLTYYPSEKFYSVMVTMEMCIVYCVKAVNKTPFRAIVQWMNNLKTTVFSSFLRFLSNLSLLRNTYALAPRCFLT